MKQNFVEWLMSQHLSDELKTEIFERFRDEVETAVNNSGGYVDEIIWDEECTYSRGEQYFVKNFTDSYSINNINLSKLSQYESH